MSCISRTPTASVLFGFIETYFPNELRICNKAGTSFTSSKPPNRANTTSEGLDLLLQCLKLVCSPAASTPQEKLEGIGCIPLENFVALLCKLTNNNEKFDEIADICIIDRLGELMPFVCPTSEGFAVLSNSLRRANRTGTAPAPAAQSGLGGTLSPQPGASTGLDTQLPSGPYCTTQAKLWISVLNQVASAVDSPLQSTSPHYIKFNGDRDSYLQLTCHSIPCPLAYTITMWVCVDEGGEVHTKSGSAASSGHNTPLAGDRSPAPTNLTPGFPPKRTKSQGGLPGSATVTLFKCRSPIGGIEALLTECPPTPSGGGHSRGSSWADSMQSPTPAEDSTLDEFDSGAGGPAQPTPVLKHYSIAIRTIVENAQGSVDGHETVGRICLTANAWQLLALSHTCNEEDHMSSPLSFTVNGAGVAAVEADLPYPFTNNPSESQWFFCTGMCGRLSSVSLYSEAACSRALTMLYEATAAVHSFDTAFAVPTGSSSGSGNTNLGSLWMKGEYASLIANKYKPVFCITAGHFMSAPTGASDAPPNMSCLTPVLPYSPTGISRMECSIMKPLSQSASTSGTKVHLVGEGGAAQDKSSLPPGAQHEPPTSSYASSTGVSLLIPSLSGSCVIHRNTQNWNWALLSSGGCIPLLYMLFHYCRSHPAGPDSRSTSSGAASAAHSACISATLNLIAHFLKSSVDGREQFLLLHGFHVVALCLHSLPQKEVSITRGLVERCFDVVRAFGLDATLGDGVAAALQGLLFNFHQVWGFASGAIKELVLTNLVSLLLANNSVTFSAVDGAVGGGSAAAKTVTSGDHLYKYIGLQRILDVLKLYLLPAGGTSVGNSPAASPAQPLNVSSPMLSVDAQGLDTPGFGLDCAEAYLTRATDMCVCLLSMTLEAAFKAHPPSTTSQHRRKASPYYEVELLLIALEGVDDGALMERLLRLLYNLHLTSPALLKQVLYDCHFAETTALVVLTRNDISFCSRRLCLLLVLWALGEDLVTTAAQVAPLRKGMAAEDAPSPDAVALGSPTAAAGIVFQDEMYQMSNPAAADRASTGESENSRLNAQQKLQRANRRLSTSIKGGIKVLRRQSMQTAQRLKGSRDRSTNRALGMDEHVPDRAKWEQLSSYMRRIDKAWRIVASIRDVIAQKLPPNEVAELLGFFNKSLLGGGDAAAPSQSISLARKFYSLNSVSSSSPSTAGQKPPRSPRKNQGDKWVLDEREAKISFLSSAPPSASHSPLVTPKKGLSGQTSRFISSTGAPQVSAPPTLRRTTSGYDRSSELEISNPMDEILDIFAHDGPLMCGAGGMVDGQGHDGNSQLHVWLVLPLLPLLLSYTSLHNIQRTLMLLSVTMKTDDSEALITSILTDSKSWITCFVQLAVLGADKKRATIKAAHGVKGTSTSAPLPVSPPAGGYTRQGDDLSMDTDLEISETCIELALDCLALVIEKKMAFVLSPFYQSFHSVSSISSESDYELVDAAPQMSYSSAQAAPMGNSWAVWKALFKTLTKLSGGLPANIHVALMPAGGPAVDGGVVKYPTGTTVSAAPRFMLTDSGETLDKRLAKRAIALVFQRLARTADPWAEGMQIFNCISEAMLYVETNELCFLSCLTKDGDVRTPSMGIDDCSSSSDTTTELPARVTMNEDEGHLLCFLIDLCANLRRHANKGVLGGREWASVLIGMRVVVSCLGFCTDDLADRCAHELYLLLIYLCQPWGAGSSEVLKNYLLMVFDELHRLMVGNSAWTTSNEASGAAHASPAKDLISPHLYGRYSALMFSFMHHFSDLRDSSHAGVAISPHVEPILDALLGVDTCNQVELLFQLVQVSLRASDIVSASPNAAVAHSGSHSRTQSRALSATGDAAAVESDDGLLIDLDGFSDSSGGGDDGPEDGEARVLPSPPSGVALATVDTSAVNFKPGTMERDITSNALDDYYNPTGPGAGAGTFAEEPAGVTGEPDLLSVIEFTSPAMATPVASGASKRPLPMPPTPPPNDNVPVTPVSKTLTRTNSESRRLSRERELELQYNVERERSLQHWLESSYGVLLDRKDAELVRLSRTVQFQESGAVATQRLWSKVSSKYESEFLVAISVLDCLISGSECGDGDWRLMHNMDRCPSASYEWKLGIAHESSYPGRERKVIRRQHLDQAAIEEARRAERERAEERQRNEDENREAMEAFQRKALAEAAAAEGGDEAGTAKLPLPRTDLEDLFAAVPLDSSAIAQSSVPGGWGIVDTDGTGDDVTISENDYESVAESSASEAPSAPTEPLPERSDIESADADVQSSPGCEPEEEGDEDRGLTEDVAVAAAARVIEEAERQQGRVLDTGPVDEGVRAFSSAASRQRAAHLQEADIILVTAGGSFPGKIAFNNKEVWIASASSSIESVDQAEKRNKKQRGEDEDPGETAAAAGDRGRLKHADAASVNAGGGGPMADKVRHRKWAISGIAFVFLRRYRLRDSALEVLFQQGSPHKSFFVDFGHTKTNMRTRNEFAKALMAVAPPAAYKQSFVPAAVFRMAGSSDLNVTQKWIDGEMSNYDYLMTLNTLAGRTYNDLCQYPVMPWILSQYTESHINLRHRRNYRDLSKPMGAQNEARLNDYIERYESFADNNVLQEVPPFMYGSHYSTMVGVVLHYLVRLQPFASLHKEMQTGHFDVPDRLFSSIPRCYHHNTTMLSEVKELTPEWFAMPEFLKNVNKYKFGTSQEGEVVDDVILPPWCSTAEEFISINREALESDYVSMHLHQWIDLIFGFKQTGRAAIDANNVFYYLTYYGAVNRDAISESMRRAIELQIAHFGSHPMQLFKRPHPAKKLRIHRPAPRSFQFCFPAQHVFYGPQHNHSSGGISAVNMSMDPTAPVLMVPGAAVDNPKDHGRPSLGVAAYPCTADIPISACSSTLDRQVSSTSILNNTVFSSVLTVGGVVVDSVSMNTSSSGNSRWGVQSIDSLEEFLSVDSAATLVSRRRTICRILRVTVLADQIVCVLDNGIIEVYRYGMSPGAKAAIMHIQAAMNQQQVTKARGGGRHSLARGRAGGSEGAGPASSTFPILGAEPLDPYSADSSTDAAVCNLLYRRSHFVHAYRAHTRAAAGSTVCSPQKRKGRPSPASSGGGSIADLERQHYADKDKDGVRARGKGSSPEGAGAKRASALEAEEHNLMDMISFDDGFITTAVAPPTVAASQPGGDSEASKYARAGRDKDTGRLLTLDKTGPMPLPLPTDTGADVGAMNTNVAAVSTPGGSLLDLDGGHDHVADAVGVGPRGSAAENDEDFLDSSSEEEEVEQEEVGEEEVGHTGSGIEQTSSGDAFAEQEERDKHEAIAAVQALMEREQCADAVMTTRSSGAMDTPGRTTKPTPGTPGTKEKERSIPPMVCNGDIVVAVERDSSHFEQPPRIPLAFIISNTSSYSNYLPHTTAQNFAQNTSYVNQMCVYRALLDNYLALARTVHMNDVNNKLMYSFGYSDGRISVRTFDQRLGTVTLGSEYRAHKHPVVCVASDVVVSCHEGMRVSSTELSNTNADMLMGAAGVAGVPPNLMVLHASVDAQGVLTVWSMVRKCSATPAGQANTNPNSTAKWLVAKRPLSVFKLITSVNRHAAAVDMNAHCCDISSSMNIAVASSYVVGSADGSSADSVVIAVLSLERKETIHTFGVSVTDVGAGGSTGSGSYTFVDKLCVSSEGAIVLHLVRVDTATKLRTSTICAYSLVGQLLGSTSTVHTRCTPVYRSGPTDGAGAKSTAGSTSGSDSVAVTSSDSNSAHTGTCVTSLASLVTYMTMPAHSGYLLTGHENGTVCVWSALNLALLYTCAPHETFQRYTPTASPLASPGSSSSNAAPQPKVSPSPILHVTLGPNPSAPIVMAISTLSGQLYVRPLPDFLTVERTKGILSLAQLVSAPLTQLTKTTSQVANWTSDTATVAAQNAKQMADEAYVELRKTANAVS